MKKIITNEFIQYKAGFLDGKTQVLKNILNLSDSFLGKDGLEDGWYQWGYEDGFSFYMKTYLKDLEIKEQFYERKFLAQLLEHCYAQRVMRINEEYKNEVAISKFYL